MQTTTAGFESYFLMENGIWRYQQGLDCGVDGHEEEKVVGREFADERAGLPTAGANVILIACLPHV